ncbi:uncharacterized protein [Diadema setosum]|uniref:uncharacterized protein n=1 Tax=Diadema setosum TaxID=31175 RepID=UPI003B3AD0B5
MGGYIIGPVIEQCGDSPLPPAAVCTLKASRRKSKVDLDCRLGGFTGNASLIWSSSEKPTIPSHRHTNQLPDGSLVLVATISVDAKEEFEQTLTCSAEGDDIAGYPSATVTILAMKAGLSTGVWVFIALLAVIIVVAISMVVTLVVLRIRSKLRRPRARSHEAIPLVGIDQRRQSIRKEMQDYDGGNVNIKIYGRRGSGKSALINSMNFALSGISVPFELPIS